MGDQASKLKTRLDLLRLKASSEKKKSEKDASMLCGRYMLTPHVSSDMRDSLPAPQT